MWLYDHSYHPQNDQVATQRFTSEEKRALERIQEDMYSDFRRAAEAHRYHALCCTYLVSSPDPTLEEGKGSGEFGHNPWARERNLSAPMRVQL